MENEENKSGLKVYTPIRQFIDEESPTFYSRKMTPPDWESYGSDYGGEVDEKIHLREIIRRILKHKWLILSLVVIVTTLVTIQAYRIKPWYTASTILEIGKENSMTLKTGDIILNDDSDPNYLININTKILALNNPELFEDVVTDLQLDQNQTVIESLRTKSFLSTLAFWKSEAPKSETPPPANNPTPKTTKTEKNRDPEESRRLAPFIGYVQRNVSYEPIRQTKALRISFTDGDPALAASISNSIAKFFRQRSFDIQTEKFTKSSDWLDRTTRELKAKVEASEEALTKYTNDNKIYSTDFGNENKTETLTTSKLSTLHDNYVKAQTEKILKSSLYEQVKAGRIAELPEVFTDSKIKDAQNRLDVLNTQMAEQKVKFGEQNPKIQIIKNQIQTLNEQIGSSRKSLENKLKADYERALADEKTLLSALNSAKAEAVGENQAAIKYNILKQDTETTRGLYKDFLEKSNQAQVQIAEQNNNIKVIQNAQTPGGPVGPNRTLIILTGLIASLVAGIGLAFFLEYIDNTIKSLDDVERYAQLPTIGLIPSIANVSKSRFLGSGNTLSVLKSGEDDPAIEEGNSTQLGLINNLEKNSMMGESYRALRTSLLLSAAGNPPKTILVTSGKASEGKTTTAVNTAISLSQLGAKVLIIDCDLRRPSVHKHLGISQHRGLTNFLSSNTELAGLIQDTSIANLSVLTSGPIPPNPAELLSSEKMKDMLKLLSDSYDHIILDSPPIINVTDPVILSTIVDGTIMVIHSGKTTREVVQRSRQELLSVRAKIFGVVLNNVNLRRDGYDYYYYYRYSNYYKSNDEEVETN